MSLEPKVVGIVNTDETRVNFEFVDLNHKVIKIYKDHEEDRLDYEVPLDEDAKRKGHIQALPLVLFSTTHTTVFIAQIPGSTVLVVWALSLQTTQMPQLI